MDEENIVFRVTSLKSNGSVWTKQYNSVEELNQVVPILLEKFPHIVISKQVLKMNPVEYLISMGDRE
tara:strand:+ start:5467 stop:5667 length:201 start_codon:yes stop_codon:yes gene_type:complete